jgi:hypothetical protein
VRAAGCILGASALGCSGGAGLSPDASPEASTGRDADADAAAGVADVTSEAAPEAAPLTDAVAGDSPNTTVPIPDAGCPPGTWCNVTPANASPAGSFPCSNYGALSVQVDGAHPETAYTHFDCQGIWKSTDYGLTWNGPVNTGANAAPVTDCAGGISVPPYAATPVLYLSCIRGTGTGFWASTNDGVDWTSYTIGPAGSRQDVYPPAVDPYDPMHLLMAGHEDNVLVQSVDGGHTWTSVNILPQMMQSGGTGTLVFIDTGAAASTHDTWLYLAQGSGGQIGTWRTADAGTTWTQVSTNEKEHAYYQIYQPNKSGDVYMAGIYAQQSSWFGVLHSADWGVTWAPAGKDENENIVFGTPQHIYAMDSCCGGAANLQVGDTMGTSWTSPAVPAGFVASGLGVNQAAVTGDGVHTVILTANWTAGVWRYVEP